MLQHDDVTNMTIANDEMRWWEGNIINIADENEDFAIADENEDFAPKGALCQKHKVPIKARHLIRL